MGISLVEEVMDWHPDDVTPAQRWGLTVLARDANDSTRETWHGPEDPEILRRVRMTPKRWEATRSALLKRGLIEPVSGGHNGKTARYRIASLFAPCIVEDRRKTPVLRGAFGSYGPKRNRKDPRKTGGNGQEGPVPSLSPGDESPPQNGGLLSESPPQNGGLLPSSPPQNGGPTPLTSSSVTSSSEEDVAPSGRDSAPDARRASTGSRARATRSGSAASGKAKSAPVDKRTAEAVGIVVAALPAELRRLARPLPDRIPAEPLGNLIREQLEHRTAQQLAKRVARRWLTHGWGEKFYGDSRASLRSGIGIAVELVRAPECPHPQCEDGTDLGSGAPCRACEQRRADRRTDRRSEAGADLLPGQRPNGPDRDRWYCIGQDGQCLRPGKGPAPADGLCPECRAEQDQIAAAFASAPFLNDQELIEQPA